MPEVIAQPSVNLKLEEHITQDAGTRNSEGVDTDTCFGIPGSGLPRRHCNVDINVTVVVCTNKDVYMAIHDGRIYQNVFGRKYFCKMYASPQKFNLYIPNGARNWDDAQCVQNGKQLTMNGDNPEAILCCEGDLEKTYDKSVEFDWKLGPCFQMTEGQSYFQADILQDMWYKVTPHNGGFSNANSGFHYMGNMDSDFWKQGLSQKVEVNGEEVKDPDGVIWLCGGILYKGGDKIDSDITAVAVPIVIHNLKLGTFYYPGGIQKGDKIMSLNRPEGHFQICRPSFSADWLDMSGIWRDVKNTEDDRAVIEGSFQNTAFRLQGSTWEEREPGMRLILFGEGGDSDYEGIGADSPDGSGGCPCCRGGSTE